MSCYFPKCNWENWAGWGHPEGSTSPWCYVTVSLAWFCLEGATCFLISSFVEVIKKKKKGRLSNLRGLELEKGKLVKILSNCMKVLKDPHRLKYWKSNYKAEFIFMIFC